MALISEFHRERQKIVVAAREAGKTLAECGALIGVGKQQASTILARAKRMKRWQSKWATWTPEMQALELEQERRAR